MPGCHCSCTHVILFLVEEVASLCIKLLYSTCTIMITNFYMNQAGNAIRTHPWGYLVNSNSVHTHFVMTVYRPITFKRLDPQCNGAIYFTVSKKPNITERGRTREERAGLVDERGGTREERGGTREERRDNGGEEGERRDKGGETTHA